MKELFNIVSGFIAENEKIFRIVFGAIIFIIFFFIRNKLSNSVLKLISKIIYRNKDDKKENFITALQKPFSIFIATLGTFLALRINIKSIGLTKAFKIAVILIICWGVINYLSSNIGKFMKMKDENDATNLTAIRFISNILKIVVVLFGIVMIISELGYNINGLLTGLGVGGLAISLAAQDAVSNLISGFIIVFEKPFVVGDLVITDNIQGFVTDITMRSTTLRTLEDSLVTLPNSAVANASIVNLSKIEKRQIQFDIGLLYSTSNELLEKCTEEIRNYLIEDDEILEQPIRVHFTRFDDSSLVLSIWCYAATGDYDEFLRILNKVDLKIKSIIEENGVSFAYPSRSVYIEKE